MYVEIQPQGASTYCVFSPQPFECSRPLIGLLQQQDDREAPYVLIGPWLARKRLSLDNICVSLFGLDEELSWRVETGRDMG